MWNLYLLAVDPKPNRGGVGTSLLSADEQTLRSEGEEVARLLIVETSNGDSYEGTRRFYARQGFDREAVIR